MNAPMNTVRRVAIVEDHGALRIFLRDVLTQLGWQVTGVAGTAESGYELVVETAWRGGRFDPGDPSLTWQSLFAERPTMWLLMLSGLFHFGRAYATLNGPPGAERPWLTIW